MKVVNILRMRVKFEGAETMHHHELPPKIKLSNVKIVVLFSNEKKIAQTDDLFVQNLRHLQRSRSFGERQQVQSANATQPTKNRRQLAIFELLDQEQYEERRRWLQDSLLLHELVPVSHKSGQIQPRRHNARSVHAHHLRLRLAEERQALFLRKQRRN